MSEFLAALKRRVLLCDGGMGSIAQATDLDVEKDYRGAENCTDVLNLSRPDFVLDVHKGYLAAGSDVLLTNSFGGSPVTLADSARAVAQVRPQQIRRALRNLIENAIVYGDRAHVSVSHLPGQVRITVADEGPGIAPDRMAEMLEPFTRLEGSRNRETGGAGLGLALVRAIMIEHHGELLLANRPEGGLEASLVLPA